MNEGNRSIWIAFIIIVVIAALGLWWVSWNQPISSSTPGSAAATSTSATTTPLQNVTNTAAVNRSSDSVVAVAESLAGASRFQSLLGSTGVAAKLTGKGPYTIFVPTDGSMSELPSGTISDMTKAQLVRFVEYHVVVGRAINAQAESAGSIQSMSGDPLNFSYNTTKIPMVDSGILITEYKASNGVVYLIDNALLAPQKPTV